MALAVLCVSSATASLQGLYTTNAGQLAVIENITAGTSRLVGPPLSRQGFSSPGGCSAGAIDQTRKIHYTLARNASAARGWALVGVFLENGLVRSVQALPAGFSLADRCDHTLNVDEEDRVLVSALRSSGLTLLRISPDHGHVEVLADGVPTALQPAGGAQPSSAFHDLTDSLWLQLGARAVGFRVLNRTLTAAVSVAAPHDTMYGLGLDVRNQRIVTLLGGGDALAIGAFDPAAPAPAVEQLAPVAPAAIATAMSDCRALAVVQANPSMT